VTTSSKIIIYNNNNNITLIMSFTTKNDKVLSIYLFIIVRIIKPRSLFYCWSQVRGHSWSKGRERKEERKEWYKYSTGPPRV
jgi:hypothetical protein